MTRSRTPRRRSALSACAPTGDKSLLIPLYGSLGPLGQKYGGADPNADLKALTDAWWSFNGTPNDSGPNALHLTPVNSPTYGTGHVYAQAANLVAASSQYFKRPAGTEAA